MNIDLEAVRVAVGVSFGGLTTEKTLSYVT